MTNTNELIGIKDVATTLGISEATVRNWIKLGKIEVADDTDKVYSFDKYKITELKKSLESGNNKALRARRNKKYVSGNSMYRSYISSDSSNLLSVTKLLSLTENNINDYVIEQLLTDCAEKLMLRTRISGNIISPLLDDLAKSCQNMRKANETEESQIKAISVDSNMLKNIDYDYIEGEDTLGFLYISLLSLSTRKSSGAYYTDAETVKKVCKSVSEDVKDDAIYMDPCCGTGNFLMQLTKVTSIDNMYGYDIDEIATSICRINLAMKFALQTTDDLNILFDHVKVCDFLLSDTEVSADVIVGNPPWGFDFNGDQLYLLGKRFYTASGKKADSADIFIECALSHLNENGHMSFVLPESVLNVKAHLNVRKYIRANADIKLINYLGDIFYKVQCPCIILSLQKKFLVPDFEELANEELFCTNLKIVSPYRSFIIASRTLNVESFDVLADDEEYDILSKMESGNKVYLKDNADFGLGIVTGNNKVFITDELQDEYEVILKGADIQKYNIDMPQRYIKFVPKNFQQVAPEYIYRSEERLLYRFIAENPVVVYDNKKLLSMNSCNIIIPHIEGMPIPYIMAVLNSSAVEFYYKHKFKSVKVLRAFLESIPIPVLPKEEMDKISEMAQTTQALGNKVPELYNMQCAQIDSMISKAYGLTAEEIHKF